MSTHISPLATAISFKGTHDLSALTGVPADMKKAARDHASRGKVVRWGLPFHIKKALVLKNNSHEVSIKKQRCNWLCFLHTSAEFPIDGSSIDSVRERALTGFGNLNALAACYYIQYEDGTELRYEIRQRYQINTIQPGWGENCFDAVSETIPYVMHQDDHHIGWGRQQTVHDSNDRRPFMNYICAWKNPHPKKNIIGIRFESGDNTVVVSGLCACNTVETPLRWLSRKKALVKLPQLKKIIASEYNDWEPNIGQSELMFLDEKRRKIASFDMGMLISAVPRYAYENEKWPKATFHKSGTLQNDEFIIEYAAHPEAQLHLINGKSISVKKLQANGKAPGITVIPPAEQTVIIKVVDKKSKQPVAVRLHIHGQSDEYLTPVDRHRLPNKNWFEDYAPELTAWNMHNSTYIDGHTQIKLPQGKIYLEISKGFECKPIHKIVNVTAKTKELVIEIDKVLDWRERGWITADTHVHFLSPKTANLEGAAEGVHVVNLLASQWGELMTNAGDFDGKTTFTTSEANDDYVVRVGTENRQHVMGHISLCGYDGSIIAPMCVGGADEAAIGDPVDILLTEWAQKCQAQNGIVVIPHSPNPRAEHAAAVITGHVDAMEIPSFEIQISPYQLVNWYRYLNCGFQVPLTGGTDKMWAGMEIGRIRAYSKIKKGQRVNYESWKESMRSGNTFVTFGPLMEFFVDGKEAGEHIHMKKDGGRVCVTWEAQSVKYEMTRLELVVNGEVVDGKRLGKKGGSGFFEVDIKRSSWICLLIRGINPSGDDVILAHSSAVMIHVKDSQFFAAADANSILQQIEGSMAYLEHIGTRADEKRYREMRLTLERAHKILHDRLHQLGHDHQHGPGQHKH